MRISRTRTLLLFVFLFLGLALTMSGISQRAECKLVNVGGMDNHCQCTSRIEQ